MAAVNFIKPKTIIRSSDYMGQNILRNYHRLINNNRKITRCRLFKMAAFNYKTEREYTEHMRNFFGLLLQGCYERKTPKS